jgi:molecular chaperone DnaK
VTRAIGIDLGTTNSVAAECEGTQARVITTRDGKSFTPSVVGYYVTKKDPTGKIVVGRAALDNALRAPTDTVFSIKRLMGMATDDKEVQEAKKHLSYRIEAAEDASDPGVRVIIHEKQYTPTEVSSIILAQIKDDAELALGDDVSHAVITVPAYFQERQREATRQAGEQAGLVVKRIIDEPTAAAIAFGAMQADVQRADADSDTGAGSRHRILVFDMGGGTFDLSIIQIVGDRYQVLDISGDMWLGGDDFDRIIAEMIVGHVRKEYPGYDPSEDPGFMMFAKKYAEEAKIALTRQPEYELIVPNAARTSDGDIIDIEMTIERDDFNKGIQPAVDRAMDLVREVLRQQSLEPEDITQVLLVGGSTAVPLVSDSVVEYFGKGKVKRNVDPMQCVALGAAILADRLQGVECPKCKAINSEERDSCEKCGHTLAAARSVGADITSVTASTLGIAVVNGDDPDHFEPIIPKGTTYPLRQPKRKEFRPSVGDQRRVRIPVYEGESPRASRNSLQGVIEFDLPRGLKEDTAVEVAFNYDRNRGITVGLRAIGTDIRDQKRLARTGDYYDQRRPQPEEEHEWRQLLEATAATATDFVSKFGDYLTPGQKTKMETDAAKAWDVGHTDNETEGRRLQRALQSSVFGSGIASQLFLAERAMDGAEPSVAQQIQKAMSLLKEAVKQKDQKEIQKIRNVLQRKTEQVFAQRMTREAVGDRDYGDLLRVSS